MKIRNLKNYKSSLLGIVFCAVGIYVLIQQIPVANEILYFLFGSGVLLLFAPDTYINLIEKKLFGKILFQNKKDDGEL